MTPTQTSSDDWQPCQPGTLQRLADQQRRTQRIATAKRIAIPAATMVLLIAVGLTTLRQGQSQRAPHGGISCGEVAANLNAYAENRVDAALAEKIAEHMRDCPRCRHKLEAMQAANTARIGNRSLDPVGLATLLPPSFFRIAQHLIGFAG